MLRVSDQDIEWEDDVVSAGAIYKGAAFSGLLIYDYPDIYQEENYQAGKLCGRAYGLDARTNALLYEKFFDNGSPVGTHTCWLNRRTEKLISTYEEGEIMFARLEDAEGKLLFEFDGHRLHTKEWFPNGQPRSYKRLLMHNKFYDFPEETYWDDNGVWLMTRTNLVDHAFNAPHIVANSHLFETEEQQEVARAFAKSLLTKEIEAALAYLGGLTRHTNPWFRFLAAKLLGESKQPSALPFLQYLLDDLVQPKTEMRAHWRGYGKVSKAPQTILEAAKNAIQAIEQG